MKDNISIIFAAMIGTFLIVLLPLYSILDRQDSMSYNVVLTETTKFVDNIRNNGFIDKESYYNYLGALASTSNSYKVTIEAYKKTLVPETDELGNVKPNSYVEEIELYNTKDILEVIDGSNNVSIENSNIKNNVYLFEKNDEIYVKVHNTNVTSGSIIYNLISGKNNTEVINVSYGGVVNNINWELYDKLKIDSNIVPEVILSVPKNGVENSNIKKINSDGFMIDVDCSNLAAYEGREDIEDLEKICEDIEYDSSKSNYYIYLYDLNNRKIGINLDVPDDETFEIKLASGDITTVTASELSLLPNNQRNLILNAIKNSYIELDGLSANIKVTLSRKTENIYTFNIMLSNVDISEINYLSNTASIKLLPGFIKGETKTISLGNKNAQVDSLSSNNYTYLYDLQLEENKTIKTSIELRRVDAINTGKNASTHEDIYTKISDLSEASFTGTGDSISAIEKYILDNYIILNGMYAKKDLKLRRYGDYYVFDLTLTNVRMSALDYISSLASITIAPGLGIDENGVLSLGTESVEIELTDINSSNTVIISEPHKWNKLLKTKSLTDSRILSDIVYAGEELAFVISYTGITGHADDEIVEAVKNNLKIFSESSEYSNLEVYSVKELNDEYDVNISTETAGHVLVKFKYNNPNDNKDNYIRLLDNWITTNIEDIVDAQEGETLQTNAKGATSTTYYVREDDCPPYESLITLSGDIGENDWYTSDVEVTLIKSSTDTVRQKQANGSSIVVVGGSGVDRNTITLNGAGKRDEQEVDSVTLSTDGITYAVAKAYDYVGNSISTDPVEIKVDKTAPTAPKIELLGTQNEAGAFQWYVSKVDFRITPGTDDISGVDRTTYTIVGANSLAEQRGTTNTLTKDGKSTIIARTYDKAGNFSETQVDVYIDRTIPNDAKIEVVSGTKNSEDNLWYTSDVTLKITVDVGDSISGLGLATYKITGNSEVPITEFEGTTTQITINTNGTHNLTVYTYTVAGNIKATQYTVNIDKDAPNAPEVSVVSGTLGKNDWYTSDVELQVKSKGDIGPSVQYMMSYTLTKDGTATNEREIKNNGKIELTEEGIYELKVYARDTALNMVEMQKTIKIDKTAPNSADFIINGTKGIDDWYTSDVYLSHTDVTDNASGIFSIELSQTEIKQNTEGTKVTLTTTDNAGHSVSKEIVIKIDKSVPDAPIINFGEEPTGSGLLGVALYNKDVNVSVIPGKDYFIQGKDNYLKTTYTVLKNSQTVVEEKEIEDFTLSVEEEATFTVIVKTYDKAGNVGEKRTVVWINKAKTDTPKIVSINGINVENVTNKEIKSTSNKLTLQVANLWSGNEVKVVLINQKTYESIEIVEIAQRNEPLEIELDTKGEYSINVIQINMFGTVSDTSTGLYYYTYE